MSNKHHPAWTRARRNRCSVIVIKDDRILLLRHRDSSLWSLPGGRMRGTFLPHERARRLLQAQTTLEVGTLTPLTLERGNEEIMALFLATTPADPLPGESVAQLDWFLTEALPAKMNERDRQLIQASLTPIRQFPSYSTPPPTCDEPDSR